MFTRLLKWGAMFNIRIVPGGCVAREGSLASQKRILKSYRQWVLAGIVLLIILGMLCVLVVIPAAVRALPGRYAARLPGFLQDLRHRPHPDLLPTPAIAVKPLPLSSPTPLSQHLRGVTFGTTTPNQGSETKESEAENPPATLAAATATRASVAQPTSPPPDTPTSAPTVTVMPTATEIPTATETPPTPTPSATPPPVSASLPPITHTYQTWNNCGPATLSMALIYHGQSGTQAEVASFLKPDPEDKNVSPYEMAAYVRSLGLEAVVRVGGDMSRLKQLIAAGYAVVVETWFIPDPGDQMGHYRLLVGYDDDAHQFTAQDSYNGPNVPLNYAAFDELWRVFNRVFLVVYTPSQAGELAAILGEDWDDASMYTRALETAQVEAANPASECVAYEDCADGTAFAWFNIGSSLTGLGRHEEAASAYDQARVLGLPWRMLWYQFGPYESYYAVNRFEDVTTLATVTLAVVDNLEESYYWRGRAFLAQGEKDQARADFQAAIKYNPSFSAAIEALESLE